jgi:hypothetical protein
VETRPDDPEALEAQIARHLPVISTQQDSLAAVMLARWLRLVGAHGPAGLEVRRRGTREHWTVHWRTPTHRTQTLEAPTLAELYVRLYAALPDADRRRLQKDAG